MVCPGNQDAVSQGLAGSCGEVHHGGTREDGASCHHVVPHTKETTGESSLPPSLQLGRTLRLF